MSGIIASLGMIGTLIFILLIIMIPISIYAAQKWAHKCYTELRRTNAMLERLLESQNVAAPARFGEKSDGIDIQIPDK